MVPRRVSWLFSRTSGETGVRRCRRSVLALLLRKSVRPGRFAQAAVQPSLRNMAIAPGFGLPGEGSKAGRLTFLT